LFNLAELLPEGQRATRIFEGRSELIDHIFVSRSLLETVEAVSTVAPRSLPSITDDANDRRDRVRPRHDDCAAQPRLTCAANARIPRVPADRLSLDQAAHILAMNRRGLVELMDGGELCTEAREAR
jgi:hypothetical protein